MWGDTEMARTQPRFSEWAHGMGEKIKATNSYNRKRPLPWTCQPWKGESLFNSVLKYHISTILSDTFIHI